MLSLWLNAENLTVVRGMIKCLTMNLNIEYFAVSKNLRAIFEYILLQRMKTVTFHIRPMIYNHFIISGKIFLKVYLAIQNLNFKNDMENKIAFHSSAVENQWLYKNDVIPIAREIWQLDIANVYLCFVIDGHDIFI